jgi:hypothetical protein
MKTVTLNHIVRNTLMDMQYPLHYYTRFLHYGIQCLEELNYDFPLGDSGSITSGSESATASNVKSVELDVTTYMRAILPADCVDVVDVSGKYGEHILPLRKDQSLNLIQNYDDAGNKIAHSDQNKSYNIDSHAGEIVFNNSLTVNKVVLTYISDGITTSEANVVHPYAQDVIKKYIIYQKHYHTNASFNKVGISKQDFHNAKRKLRARLNALTYADIVSTLRTGIHGSIKN